ncbi:hypothetical protein [Microvirgula aerodenitrificans]|uniref:hypothetical protein n=1 Tax=Microvirgula aerodenitrificans TaxID=57480 RepID=UPI0035711F64
MHRADHDAQAVAAGRRGELGDGRLDLRAVALAHQAGLFELDQLEAGHHAAGLLADVLGERVRAELLGILAAGHAEHGLDLLRAHVHRHAVDLADRQFQRFLDRFGRACAQAGGGGGHTAHLAGIRHRLRRAALGRRGGGRLVGGLLFRRAGQQTQHQAAGTDHA